MDFLKICDGKIVNSSNSPINLRGTGVGGWMNMENFINGYPGVEHALRATSQEIMGDAKTQLLFDCWMDSVLDEQDIAFIKNCGATVIRLPLNYRHFESDQKPFEYQDSGFERLDAALHWCRKHQLYAILDLHAAQGWQNPDWHSDNNSRQALFWTNPHYQDRFISLWEQFARRYKDHPEVAGYDLLNEPVSGAPHGFLQDPWKGFPGHNNYKPRWDIVNDLYERTTKVIRQVDPQHIIFFEGDLYSAEFDGLILPPDDNIGISTHNYHAAGWGPGKYPGECGGRFWDKNVLEKYILGLPSYQYSQKHNVPLWIGEFGSTYNGLADEKQGRLQSMDDEIEIYNKNGIHWTTWTYKDIGIMSWVIVKKSSSYWKAIQPVIDIQDQLGTEAWMQWMPKSKFQNKFLELVDLVVRAIPDRTYAENANCRYYMSQAAISCYVSALLQPLFIRIFASLEEKEIVELMTSFKLENCEWNEGLITILKKHFLQ